MTKDFYLSHQWLRELKRWGRGSIAGVYFRIADQKEVWVGHYGGSHVLMKAAEATAEFLASEPRQGWEVIIPRRIDAKEIHRVRVLPQVLGWRYFPGAHGKLPLPCKCCQTGGYGSRKIRFRLGDGF